MSRFIASIWFSSSITRSQQARSRVGQRLQRGLHRLRGEAAHAHHVLLEGGELLVEAMADGGGQGVLLYPNRPVM